MTHAVAVAAAAGSDAAVVAGIEDAYEEIAVAAATPTPVDVEEIVAVEAIEHEGMSAARRVTGEEDGIACLQFVVNHVEPLVDAVVATTCPECTLVIAEDVDEEVAGVSG